MAHWKARGLGLGLLAGVCALNAAPAWADDDGYTALILGHAFLSQPDATYMQEVIDTYVDNPVSFGQPQYSIAGDPVSVYTPETDYNTGLTQGIADLDKQLQPLLQADPHANLVVAGYSMSTSVITQEMINLANTAGGAPDTDGLKFVLAEDLQNPNGGYFTRFPDAFAAMLPATPSDTPYETTIYSIQYSGASDFPQYYGNTWADLNAANGYVDLHPYLLPNWPAYFDPSTVADAVKENVSDGYAGSTEYYLIPTQDLPLLDGLRLIPGAPNAYADLVQPDMRVLVDLGYNYTGAADVTTPATLANPDIDFAAVNDYLEAGANQGMLVSLVDLGLLPQSDLAGIADLYPYVPDLEGLIGGALSDPDAAALDLSLSSAALADALSDSTNPFIVEFGQYIPGMVSNLADFYQMLAGTLG
ncbi:PE-PPE domain-containing protein [Mycobacterium paraterrae]|uniref:PE-PPE domain-containing protein n=1 Tax=Mycobacterium paraterrae TaxID=577492 RepID=A0ABY3VTX7_9MYCO|nr:PE-PPE domain-containing protein [Mycobacterium paraterrae]UMB70959.1 PE-PPE domain-containing protein [Mycobacterium paraterrae]